jgi:ABC-type transport system involved in multi-copper enzyme maturation permease subunit
MSTLTLTPEAATAGTAGPAPRITMRRVINSEWIKLRSLRSTWIMLAGIFGVIVVFGLLSAAVATGDVSSAGGGPNFRGSSPVDTVMSGANFGVLLVAVFGVLMGAREYSSGLIRATLAAIPARMTVLVGKLTVFVCVVAPAVLAGTLVAFLGGTAILSQAGAASATWSDPGVAGAVLGTAGYLLGIGVLGVALGMLFRGIGAGIGVLIGGILFVPTLAIALLPDSWDSVLKYLPSSAGQSFTSIATSDSLLSYWGGVAVFAVWVVIAIGATAWSLMRRDA